jgi:hypothetical protein
VSGVIGSSATTTQYGRPPTDDIDSCDHRVRTLVKWSVVTVEIVSAPAGASRDPPPPPIVYYMGCRGAINQTPNEKLLTHRERHCADQ